MLKVAVTGMGGQLALCLKTAAKAFPSVTLQFFDREEWNITDEKKTRDILGSGQWDVLINAAAYTAVDKAEEEVDEAFDVNTRAVAILGETCREEGVYLVHISTDYVYDNGLFRPLRETDETSPKGVYARSKLDGELRLKESGVPCTVFRTSWVYSTYGHNFIKTMIRLLGERAWIKVVCDQHGVPTSADDLATAILTMLINDDLKHAPSFRVFNYAPKGWTTWYGITRYLNQLLKADCTVIPIPSREYATAASRPTNSIMNCRKFDEAGWGARQDWKISLGKVVHQLLSSEDRQL